MIWWINTQTTTRPLQDLSNNMLFLVMRQLRYRMHKLINVLITGLKLLRLSVLQWNLVSVTTSLTLLPMANYHQLCHFRVEFDHSYCDRCRYIGQIYVINHVNFLAALVNGHKSGDFSTSVGAEQQKCYYFTLYKFSCNIPFCIAQKKNRGHHIVKLNRGQLPL